MDGTTLILTPFLPLFLSSVTGIVDNGKPPATNVRTLCCTCHTLSSWLHSHTPSLEVECSRRPMYNLQCVMGSEFDLVVTTLSRRPTEFAGAVFIPSHSHFHFPHLQKPQEKLASPFVELRLPLRVVNTKGY